MNGWINTSEDVPIVGKDVLFAWNGKVCFGYFRGDIGTGDKVWEMYTMFGARSVPAHEVKCWMPLPKIRDDSIPDDPYSELCEQLGVEP